MKAISQTAANSGVAPADLELARRCARGDETALRRVFEEHEPALRRVLYRMLGNLEDAEELSAGTLLRFWRSAGRYRGECSLRAFLTRIALNLARDQMRRPRSLAVTSLTDTGSLESLATVEVPSASDEPSGALFDAIRSGFNLLLPEERQLLALYYLDDWDYGEICAALGIEYAVLRTRLVRARKHLREIVGSEDEE